MAEESLEHVLLSNKDWDDDHGHSNNIQTLLESLEGNVSSIRPGLIIELELSWDDQ